MSTGRWLFPVVGRRTGFAVLLSTFMAATVTGTAAASGPDETALDAATLSQMEQRADHALVRDQCYLYTEVVHGLTELAGRQLSAGQDEEAAATIRQVDLVAGKIGVAASKDPKKLKNAELLLEHTSERLKDMLRAANDEEREVMRATLRHLNAVHTGVLTMVFAH
jgi:hypothetical protein